MSAPAEVSGRPAAHDGGPAAGAVFLAVSSTNVALACGHFGGTAAFLGPAEKSSARRFRRTADRLDYEASHALFRLLAAWSLGLPPGDAAGLRIDRRCVGCGGTDHGKPSVRGTALSLSRSHGAVMVAAGPAGSTLGADIERIPERFFDGFDDFAAAPAERARLDSMATTAVGPAVAGAGTTERTRLWVAKEAVLKAAGLGLAVEPSSVALTQPWNSPSGSLTAGRFPARRGHEGPLQALCPAVPAVHGLEVSAVPAPAGYVAAVSARTGLPPRRLGLPEMFATSLQTSNV